jgi:hypothetical protein
VIQQYASDILSLSEFSLKKEQKPHTKVENGKIENSTGPISLNLCIISTVQCTPQSIAFNRI